MSLLLILIPLFGIILLNLPLGSFLKKLSFWFCLVFVLLQVTVAVFPVPAFRGQSGLFGFALSVDPLSLVMLLSIAIVSLAALFTGWFTLPDGNKKFDFVNLLLLTVAGMNGIVLVTDLFSLYVFLEITAVSSFILIALHKDLDALEGAFKYILLSAIATILMLSSIALLFMAAGSTSFIGVKTALAAPGKNLFALIAFALFLAGLFIKGGLMPFHGWLPDAYASAPAGVSVLLAGIVTKTTGVYTLIRLISAVFGFNGHVQTLLLIVGTFSIVTGALAALGQKDLKRMLAFSSISQVGYIIAGLGAGTPLGVAGAVFHLFNHAVFKSQLFVNAAAVEEQLGFRDMDKMGGLASKMPVTGTTSVIAILSTAGVPPLSGFWSKLIIIIALWTSGNYFYAAVTLVASVITLAYFLSMQRRVFFGKTLEEFKTLKEADAGLVFPALLLAAITIAVGIFFPYILNTFILPIRSILG